MQKEVVKSLVFSKINLKSAKLSALPNFFEVKLFIKISKKQ